MLSACKVHVTIIHRVVLHLFVIVLVKVKSAIHYHPLVELSGGGYRFCPILQPIQIIEYCNPLLFSYLRNRNHPLKSSPELSIINSRKVVPRSSPILWVLLVMNLVLFKSLNRRLFFEPGRPESPRGEALATTLGLRVRAREFEGKNPDVPAKLEPKLCLVINLINKIPKHSFWRFNCDNFR